MTPPSTGARRTEGPTSPDDIGARRTEGPTSPDETVVDWGALREAALAVAEHAYVPYSQFHVGAAGLTDDGRIITGCNVENASYGLTLCAECALVSILHVTGGGRLVAVVTVGNGQPVMPCGRCRQLLWEHGGPDCLLDGDGTPQPMRDVLPGAFDASRLLPG